MSKQFASVAVVPDSDEPEIYLYSWSEFRNPNSIYWERSHARSASNLGLFALTGINAGLDAERIADMARSAFRFAGKALECRQNRISRG